MRKTFNLLLRLRPDDKTDLDFIREETGESMTVLLRRIIREFIDKFIEERNKK